MMRPRVDEILKPLKPFQRRTVDHAFHRLFTAQDSTSRFLVADEVGLGKTLVARGIIARTIDYLWDDVERIDIIYICSNGSIARANLPKLRIGGASERSFALATRLTMLATELAPQDDGAGLAGNKLNFVSFTPRTSFNMGNSGGQWREREVLFHLLAPHVGRHTALMNLLQGGVAGKDWWRERLAEGLPIEPEIEEHFDAAFKDQDDLQREIDDLFDKWFHRYRQHWPREARVERDGLIGKLRRLLAEVCVQALEPDLVILDEFQRFKPLLEEERRGPDAELAQSLFLAQAHDCRPVRTLLLSATPYKLYTADAELEQEDHYKDFLATTRFLLGGKESRVENLKNRLARFGTALKRAATDSRVSVEEATSAKREVEDFLRAIMARTERVAASEDRDAMLIEHQLPVTLTPTDVRQYLAADAVFRAVGDHDPMPFWKSAPYLVHFMHGYKVNDHLNDMLEQSPAEVAKVLRRHRQAFLSAQTLQEWSKLDPAHAKLRDMVREQLDRGLWRLLWIPPTLPYWLLEGPFAGQDGAPTKTLLFSAWNVVPDVVSAILSYEAERRMVAGRLDSYQDPAKQQGPLLHLTQSVSGNRSRHRLFLLLMPCLPLADQAHPLDAPAGCDRREWVRSRVERLLVDSGLPNPQDGEIDARWEWAAPLLLDRGLRPFLRAWRDGALQGVSDDKNFPKPNPELFDLYLNDLLTLQPDELGRRPPGLVDLLTEVALGSPAILALRCPQAPAGVTNDTRRRLGVLIADAFWSLFNQPAVITLIRQLAAETGASHDEGVYWRRVLNYCQQGNLQAVLDEQWHLLWEQHAWSEGMEPNEIASECTRMLVQVVHPARSRIHARFFEVQGRSAVAPEEVRIRTVFALRFGHLPTEGDKSISQDAVRAAFNSPFRPFVLTSTSIGQEGLDFHPWCHRLVHWNLPGNPVDLEQREGRIHRYKGHAIRRNVAAVHGDAAFASRQPGQDLWALIFKYAEQAARNGGASDLVPYWIAPGDCHVQRHVPLLPYTKEVEAFQRLKRQLAIYRMVFGQPRQEELIALLDQGSMSVSELQALTIDLSPPSTATVKAAAQNLEDTSLPRIHEVVG